MANLPPNILFRPENFKHAEWKLFRFTVWTKHATRKVDVLAPLKSVAEIGVGAQKDERLTCEEVQGVMAKLSMPSQKAKLEEVSAFYNIMCKNLKAGIGLVDSLRRCAASARTPYFRGVVACLSYRLSPLGGDLSRGMALFPEIFTAGVLAQVEGGETAGGLADALETLSQSSHEDLKNTKRLKGLMVYPAVICFGIVGLMAMVQFVVIPKMMPLFKEMLKSGLPMSTRIIMGITEVCQTKPYVPVLPIAGLIFLFKSRGRIFSNHGIQRFLVSKMLWKVADLVKLLILIRSLRTLAQLLRAGVSLDKAFQITARVADNVVYANYFNAIHQRINEGRTMDEAFFDERHRIGDAGLDIAQQIQIGTTSGDVAPGLLKLVDAMQAELLVVMDALPTVINLVMLLAVMPFLILSALAIIEPSLSMAQDATRAAGGH